MSYDWGTIAKSEIHYVWTLVNKIENCLGYKNIDLQVCFSNETVYTLRSAKYKNRLLLR